MKHKMIALFLALTVAAWTQTATQTAPATPQNAEKDKCSCCDKMAKAGTKDAPTCCARHHGATKEPSCCAGKENMSCCSGKDAKSCMKQGKDQTASCAECAKDKTAGACCEGKCGKECDKDCCASKKTEKAASNCCDDDLRSENEGVHTFAGMGK